MSAPSAQGRPRKDSNFLHSERWGEKVFGMERLPGYPPGRPRDPKTLCLGFFSLPEYGKDCSLREPASYSLAICEIRTEPATTTARRGTKTKPMKLRAFSTITRRDVRLPYVALLSHYRSKRPSVRFAGPF